MILLGPYIGNFEQEILTFRPYVRWLLDILEYDIAYVSTHSNRSFMYEDFILNDFIIPIFEDLSRDELNQEGYIHKNMTQKDYQILLRNVKDTIVEKEGCNKRDIEVYSLSYVKSTPPLSIYNKRFMPIGHSEIDVQDYVDKIVFIPDRVATGSILRLVRDCLLDYDYIIIGDQKTRFTAENVVLNLVDYFENGWKYMIQIISKAKAVVCPLGYWTTICNLQAVPVFSWGANVGQHREGGIYHFGNKGCLAFPFTGNKKVLVSMLNHFLKEIGK